MCGRFVQTNSMIKEIDALFPGIAELDIVSNYNVAPSQLVAVVYGQDQELRSDLFQWGYLPSWSSPKKGFSPLINARAESLLDKPFFRDNFKSKRCVIPADGFYEWKKQESGKQPFFIRYHKNYPSLFAGLWDTRKSDTGEEISGFTIITTEAAPNIRELHHRMPVELPVDQINKWLSKDTSTQAAYDCLNTMDVSEAEFYPVSKAINSALFNHPAAMDRIEL